MKTLFILIFGLLLAIPFVGSSKLKEKILFPPTHWIETPKESGVYQGISFEQYIAEVMNMLIKTDHSSKVDMTIYCDVKPDHITTQIECGNTSYHIFKILNRILDSLPHFDPPLTAGLAIASYLDTLTVSVKHYSNAPSKICVVSKLQEGSNSDQQKSDVPNDYQVTMPTFQGDGLPKFQKWIDKHIPNHKISFHNSISKHVTIQFIVGNDGYIEPYTNISHKSDPLLTQEMLRVISASPQWTPGYRDGKAVRVRYTIPIGLSLKK